ncbi:MAG: hypothetical protein ACJAS9_003112 [Polaribacter sp.]|jgi:hypothetical protein
MVSTPPPLNPFKESNTLERSDNLDTEKAKASEFKCQQCGAKLTYAP